MIAHYPANHAPRMVCGDDGVEREFRADTHPTAREVCLEAYRRTGRWPETATYAKPADKKGGARAAMGVTADMQREGDALRAAFDADAHADACLLEVYGWGVGRGA